MRNMRRNGEIATSDEKYRIKIKKFTQILEAKEFNAEALP